MVHSKPPTPYKTGNAKSCTYFPFLTPPSLKLTTARTVDPRPTDGTFVIQGFDNATFVDADTHLPRLPLEVWANNNRPNRSALGLGRSSSLLHRLLGANLIPALPFSLDYGSRSESKYRDGQLILGGYNAARRTTSGAARFNLSAFSAPVPCPLQVLLSDVILTDHVTGVSTSLFEDPGARVAACVDPLQNVFAFTPKMFEKWQRLTGWISYDGSNYSQQTYPADREARMGTLTIKLAGAGGYESVVPHWELVSHERGNDTNGVYRVLNTSRVMAAVTGGQTDYGNGVPVLGGVFLTQNYLVVDYPANEFWLSPLKEGMRDGGDDIRSFCREEVTVGGEKGEGGVGLGVKVGVPVGVVGGLAILGLAGAWVYRQREKRRTAEADAADVALDERHTEPPSPTPRPNLSPPSFISDRYLNQ